MEVLPVSIFSSSIKNAEQTFNKVKHSVLSVLKSTHQHISVFKVVSPVRPDLPLASNVPDIQLKTLRLDALDVESLEKTQNSIRQGSSRSFRPSAEELLNLVLLYNKWRKEVCDRRSWIDSAAWQRAQTNSQRHEGLSPGTRTTRSPGPWRALVSTWWSQCHMKRLRPTSTQSGYVKQTLGCWPRNCFLSSIYLDLIHGSRSVHKTLLEFPG